MGNIHCFGDTGQGMGIVLQSDTKDYLEVITYSSIYEIHLVRNHRKHFSGRIKSGMYGIQDHVCVGMHGGMARSKKVKHLGSSQVIFTFLEGPHLRRLRLSNTQL